MKISYNVIAFLFISAFLLSSCSHDDFYEAENEIIKGLELSIKDFGFQSSETRAIDIAYKTTFTDGDAVGVFAVKGDKIVENINNRKFEMDEGVWILEGNVIEYKASEFKKMKFYAYYPYNENIIIDTNAEDPFANVVESWNIESDLSGDNYTKNDLMTSVGEAEGERLQGKVEFTMQHRMGLAIIEMPNLVYSFTNEGLDDYFLPVNVGDFNITSGGKANKVNPYYDQATETYMILVKPNSEYSIQGTYVGVKEMTYSAKGNLLTGTAKKYTIKDESKINHTLSVGDYYCADGALVSKDVNTVPENCIGVVFYVGNSQPSVAKADKYTETQDALRRDYPSCKHGLVLALNNAVDGDVKVNRFGSTKKLFGEWFRNNEDWKDSFVNNVTSGTIDGLMGYNNSMLMEMGIPFGENYKNAALYAMSYTTAYRSAVATPSVTTKWYLPSIEELKIVHEGMGVINGSLQAVSGDVLEVGTDKSGFYWATTERNTDWVWSHTMEKAVISQRNSSSYTGYFRMMLAF